MAYLEGDRALWFLLLLLGLFSFLPVYSASSNLAYSYPGGHTVRFLIKHAIHLVFGFVLMYSVHKVNPRYYRNLPVILLPVIIVLLMVTLAIGTTIGDANASRWIRLPFIGVSFQTSELARFGLLMFVARYLTQYQESPDDFRKTFLNLVIPVGMVCALILPANFSTTALIFILCLGLMFVGRYPLKYIGYLVGMGVAGLALFILVVIAFPNISNRVDTWKARIENFGSGSEGSNYQVNKAKMAIASGGVVGKGPGKSIQKNFLPQSGSDFIYAIIVEEFGLLGGLAIILIYLLILIRIMIIATKAVDLFQSLLAGGFGMAIVFQAFINMGVAVNLLPVTGQTLPLLSSGGSSIWMTSMALGVILGVSRNFETTSDPASHGSADAEPSLEPAHG